MCACVCARAKVMLDSQQYVDNVPIIWLGAAVKTAANKDGYQKNLYEGEVKLPVQQTWSRLRTSNKHFILERLQASKDKKTVIGH